MENWYALSSMDYLCPMNKFLSLGKCPGALYTVLLPFGRVCQILLCILVENICSVINVYQVLLHTYPFSVDQKWLLIKNVKIETGLCYYIRLNEKNTLFTCWYIMEMVYWWNLSISVHISFYIMSCVEALNLIHMCIECMDSSYLYI